MKNSSLALAVIGLGISFSSSYANTELARVNDKVISLEELNSKYSEVSRTNPISTPSKKQVLDDLIRREAAVQEAKKLKLDSDPIVVDRINTVLYYALIEKKLGAEFEKMTLSDSEAKNWYEKNPEIRTSHIFIALPQDASSEDETKASKRLSEILSEIKSGKSSFAESAQKNSEDPSSATGGDLDYRLKDRLDPAYYRAALRIGRNGDITGPVRTAFGLHLIRLTGKRSWTEVDRTRVKRMILEEKKQELVSRLLGDLRQKSKVSVNEKLIKE